jgi:hypothetical protein
LLWHVKMWTCCSFQRTTKYVQPLDVFFFRQYKIYLGRTEDHVRVCLHDSGIKLHDRCFTIKMHSDFYDQLEASAYTNMLPYVWKKPGYAIHKTYDAFLNTHYRSTLDWDISGWCMYNFCVY